MTLGELKPDWPISELKQLDGGAAYGAFTSPTHHSDPQSSSPGGPATWAGQGLQGQCVQFNIQAQRQSQRQAGGRAGGGLVPIKGHLLVVSGHEGCWLVNRHGHRLLERNSGLEIVLIGSNFPCCMQEAQGLPNIGWQAWQRSQASLRTQGTRGAFFAIGFWGQCKSLCPKPQLIKFCLPYPTPESLLPSEYLGLVSGITGPFSICLSHPIPPLTESLLASLSVSSTSARAG